MSAIDEWNDPHCAKDFGLAEDVIQEQQEVIERLEAMLRKELSNVALLGEDNDRLRGIIERAPHGGDCRRYCQPPGPCDCWKSSLTAPPAEQPDP